MKALILDVVGTRFTPRQLSALLELVDFINTELKDSKLAMITCKRAVPGPRFKWYVDDVDGATLLAINKKLAETVAKDFEGKMNKFRLSLKDVDESELNREKAQAETESLANPS